MGIKITTKKNDLKKLADKLKSIHNKKVSFGYYQEQGVHYSGFTYANLMEYLENGDRDNHIPSRPVFRITAFNMDRKPTPRQVSFTIDKFINSTYTAAFTLDMIGGVYAGWAKDMFGDPMKLEPNAQMTVKIKGANTPLVDTGDLVSKLSTKNSIDNVVRVVI